VEPWENSRVIARGLAFLLLAACSSACTRSEARRYELTGQVVAVDAARQELTIAHAPIAGYMDAMTMPFEVRNAEGALGLQPGDLVRGLLVVTSDSGYLESIEKTGHDQPPASGGSTRIGEQRHIDYLVEGDRVPDAAFIDQDGRRRRLLEDPATATVVTFVYTRCPFPTFCPLIDRRFGALQEQITGNPLLATRVRLLSITLDPAHDTPAVLKQHAADLGARGELWSFVTPGDAAAAGIAGRFGVGASLDEKDPSVIVHGLVTVLIDRDGIVTKVVRGGEWQAAEVVGMLLNMFDERARDAS
jgi:protein SCO1/2